MDWKVLALTGPIASGKGVFAYLVVEELSKKGVQCVHLSYSNELREELRKKGVEITRENLQKLATDLRSKDAGMLSRMVVKKMDSFPKEARFVIETIRNPTEVKVLRKEFRKKLILVSVEAPFKQRLERARERGREGEETEEKEFRKVDERELGKNEPSYGFQIRKCMELADLKIANDSTTEDLREKILQTGLI